MSRPLSELRAEIVLDNQSREEYSGRMAERKSISAFIVALRRSWKADLGWTAKRINEGACVAFALHIVKAFEGARAIWAEDFDHAYVRFKARLYDAEVPRGVRRYTQLPCVKRQR
jgi:hypothetical protein